MTIPRSLTLAVVLALLTGPPPSGAQQLRQRSETASDADGGVSEERRRAQSLPLLQKLAVLIHAMHLRISAQPPYSSYGIARRHRTVMSTLRMLGVPTEGANEYIPGATALDYARAILANAPIATAGLISETVDNLFETFFTDAEIAAATQAVAEGAGLPGEGDEPSSTSSAGDVASQDDGGLAPIGFEELSPFLSSFTFATVNVDTDFVDF